MEYVSLGNTGLQVSRICLGTMNFGDSTDEADGIQITHAALDAGINFIDSADVYWKGLSEEIVGKAVKGKRDSVVLATKCWAPMGEGPNDRSSSRLHVIRSCENSLKRLQTDYLDLFIMHRPDTGAYWPGAPIEETLRALTDLVRQGKVRYIGTSCYHAWRIVEAQLLSRYEGLERFCSDQLNYSIMNRYVENQILQVSQKYGLGVTVFSPLNYGWLSGKYYRGTEPPTDSRAARSFKMRVDGPDADRNYDILEKLEPVVKERGVTMSQFSLAWLLKNPAITSVLSGPRILSHLEDNIKALEVELDEEAMKAVDEIAPPKSGSNAEYP